MINLFEQPEQQPKEIPPNDQQEQLPLDQPPQQDEIMPGQDKVATDQVPAGMGGENSAPVAQQGGDIEDDPPEMTPLKKYYLIEKLYILKNKLNQFNLNNDDLDRVLKFANSFSYETLISLSEKLAKNTENILREEKLNRGKRKNEK